ncbi:MAG: abortive infection system antitoxin AbiGi family protein [Desulfocucumaceae bacterium]
MKQTISANTLFHFTNSKETIISILKNGFWPHYSPEDTAAFDILPKKRGNESFVFTPMVCFCDIPLSQIKNHVKTYGKYAIGLSKTWGMQHDINPVLYIVPQRTLAHSLSGLQTYTLHKIQATEDSGDIEHDVRDHLVKYFLYSKPYKGCLLRKGERKHNVTFYDEREWRFAPDTYTLRTSSLQPFESDRKAVEVANIKLRNLPLQFQPKDIKYIIVQKENEILEMIGKIRVIKSSHYQPDDVKKLITRIISLEQILEDF